jgi:hypothetical protein
MILTMILTISVFASWANSGGISLQQAIGARAQGMGDAFTAVADDATSIYWNVGGLSQNNGIQATASYFQGLVDSSFGQLVYNQKIEPLGNIGLGLVMMRGGMVSLDMPDGGEKNVESQRDFIGDLAYAVNVDKNWGIGLGLKILNSTLAEEVSATAFGADVGVLYSVINQRLSLGATLQNIGTGIKYKSEVDPMPTTLRCGVAYAVPINQEQKGLVALDVVKANDQDYRYNLGMEYWIADTLAFRLGYKYGYDLESITAGCGFHWQIFEMDYAFGLVKDLNSIHKISLSLKLGGEEQMAKKAAQNPEMPKEPAQGSSVVPKSKSEENPLKEKAGISELQSNEVQKSEVDNAGIKENKEEETEPAAPEPVQEELIPDDEFEETHKLILKLKNCRVGVEAYGAFNGFGVNLWKLLVEAKLFKNAMGQNMKPKFDLKHNFFTIRFTVDTEHSISYTFMIAQGYALLSSVKINGEIVDILQGGMVLTASREKLYQEDKPSKAEVEAAKKEIRKILGKF